MQGDADKNVEWEANLRAISRIPPQAEIFVLSGRGHVLLDLSTEQVETLAVINSFFEEVIK